MEKRNNSVVLAVVITVLVMIILGLVMFIIFDKSENKVNEPNVEENNKENEEQLQNYDYAKITEEVNKNLQNFITYRAQKSNLLSTSDLRLELINSLLMKTGKVTWYSDGKVQDFPYVSYDVYKNLYLEVYGNNYSFDEDLASASPIVANQNNEYLGQGNISWNGTWGATYGVYNLTVEKKYFEKETNNYVLSGKYDRIDQYEQTLIETGTFKITYNKVDNANHLKSIVIN